LTTLHIQLVAIIFIYILIYALVAGLFVACSAIFGAVDGATIAGAFRWSSEEGDGSRKRRTERRAVPPLLEFLWDLLIFGPVKRKIEDIRYAWRRR
jgi:hypothetical protein